MRKVIVILLLAAVVASGTLVLSCQSRDRDRPSCALPKSSESWQRGESQQQVANAEVPDVAEDAPEFQRFLISGNMNDVRGVVQTCLAASTKERRWSLHGRMMSALQRVASLQRRQMLLEYLVQGLDDESASNRASHGDILCRHKLTLYKEDFSPAARKRLAEVVEKHGLSPATVVLSGIAEVEECYPDFEKLGERITDGKRFSYLDVEWAAALVLARAGRGDWMKVVLQQVQKETLDRQAARLEDDLAFTRQPDAMTYLRKILDSEERFHIGVPRKVAYSAVTTFATILKGFPIKKWNGDDSDEDILKARAWMNAHKGEWEFYQSASEWPKEERWPP